MPLIPWKGFLEPWEDFDRLFERWLGEFPETKLYVPPVDLYEKGKDIYVETPLVGIDPEDVEVKVEDNKLVIKGKSERKSEVEEENYYRKEIKYGSFYREIALPEKVEESKVEAEYEDGLLKIRLPKAQVKKEKKVKVKLVKKRKKK